MPLKSKAYQFPYTSLQNTMSCEYFNLLNSFFEQNILSLFSLSRGFRVVIDGTTTYPNECCNELAKKLFPAPDTPDIINITHPLVMLIA